MDSEITDHVIQWQLVAPGDLDAIPANLTLGLHRIGGGAVDDVPMQHVPVQHMAMPLLGGAAKVLYERWHTRAHCRSGRFGSIAFRCSDAVLFGVVEIDESTLTASAADSTLYAAAERVYRDIFALLDAEGYPHLWRTWNYLPDIHGEQNGLERYRQFNRGRHDAFVAAGSAVESSPAASALGTEGGLLSVAFIAGRTAPTRIENPRQVSAFAYPQQYGPRSPTFTRAATVAEESGELLFISGTASIVGHETLHRDDVIAQTRETVTNLSALLAQANARGDAPHYALAQLHYRVYVRHADDYARVRDAFEMAIGVPVPAIYVQADICRRDLLVEIEAFGARPAAGAA